VTVRVAILISGGGSNMVKLVDSMTGDHPARPVLVLSNVPGAGGLREGGARGVPTAVVDHRPSAATGRPSRRRRTALAGARADILCLAGFMRILTPAFVARHGRGDILNIHPSLLPKYPGLDTHARAIAAGDAEAGLQRARGDGELDAGPLLGQARVPVRLGDTTETLAARVLAQEHRTLSRRAPPRGRGRSDAPLLAVTGQLPYHPGGGGAGNKNTGMITITTTEGLAAFCDRARTRPYVTVDTEFLRERSYYSKLCLLQLAVPGEEPKRTRSSSIRIAGQPVA
jgi:phosphoribosylglycinamide formyltransferase 1